MGSGDVLDVATALFISFIPLRFTNGSHMEDASRERDTKGKGKSWRGV